MGFFQTLQAATQADRHYLLTAPLIDAAMQGQVNKDQYVAFLTQAYHHVRHTVPLLMACGARLPARLEWLRKAVADYIAEEYGHEQWILADIAAAGGDAAAAAASTPNQPTELMVAYVHDTIARGNPVGFFGMVNVLEGTSIALATRAAESLRKSLNLPPQAFTYLSSHGSLDISHMALFRGLMDKLDDTADQAAVVHVAKVVYRLYGDLFRSLPAGSEAQHAIA